MLFKKLFQLLVVGGATVGALSGCATTSGTDTTKSTQSNVPPPSSGTGGIRGW
jgi:hypothetical protein